MNETLPTYSMSNEADVQIALHRCTFVKYDTSSVVAISPDCSQSGNHFFVARENGDLEKHSALIGWAVELYIPNTIQSGKPITSIVELATDKVMTSTLDGFLTIWDMVRRTQLFQQSPGGGAIWCMEVDPTTTLSDTKTVAIACEDGRVRLVHIVTSKLLDTTNLEDKVSIELLEAGTSRVLSLCWSLEPDKFLLATDDSGNIRKLDMKMRRCVQVMKITQRGSPVVIWSVVALQLNNNHHYYATGDSRGTVTIWDAKTCSAINEFTVENCKGDITCLTAIVHKALQEPPWATNVTVPDVDIFFGSVDGGIAAIRGHWSSLESKDYQWIPVRGRSLHARDVRTIKAIGNNRIASGGADCRVSLVDTNEFFSEARCIRLYPSRRPHRPSCASYYCNKDLLVAEHDQFIDFWKDTANRMDKILFRYKSRRRDGNICASALSEDCCWFAVATTSVVRIYQIRLAVNGALSMEMEPFHAIHSHGAKELLWMHESVSCTYLLALSNDSDSILLYSLRKNENSMWSMIAKPRCIQWVDWVPHSTNSCCSNNITCMTNAKENMQVDEISHLFAVGDRYGNLFVFDIRDLDAPVASLHGCLSESIVSMCLKQNVLIVCGCQGQVKLLRIDAFAGKWKMERLSSWSDKSIEWLREQLILLLDLLPIYGVDIYVDSSSFLIYGHQYIILVHWEHFEEVIIEKMHVEDSMSRSEIRRPSQDHSNEKRSAVFKKIQKLPTKKLKVIYPLENVAYACFMNDQENFNHANNVIPILCLEHRWEDMLSQMPPAVFKKKFGV